jgi:hypothetical protein
MHPNDQQAEAIRRFEAHIRRELFMGECAPGQPYYLSPAEYLATHMHLIGASSFGKSFYVEHLLRCYIDVRIPASLIDPHGDHARHYAHYLFRNARLRREKKIVYFHPADPQNPVGFNPFQCGLTHPAEIASLVLEAFFKVWGERSFNETPRLERILRTTFHVLAANGLALTDAPQFLLSSNRALRQSLLTAVADERVRASWQEIEELPRSEKLERFESSCNRLERFLALPAVSRLFVPKRVSINLAEMFRRGETLVANLSGLPSTEAQSLVGTLLVNALYHAALRRPESARKPWVLAIDEFPQFVSTDMARSLDQLRKFGIRFLLAHQRLSQLPDDLRSAILTNAKIRAVFGGLERADAEILARELFTGVPTGDNVKHITTQTKFRPILDQATVESFSDSSTDSEGANDGWADGSADGTVDGGDRDSRSSHSNTQTASRGRSSARGATSGHSRSTVFVTQHEEFPEETSRQFYSLDEEWERHVAAIMNLGHRQALVKVFKSKVQCITTPEIRRVPLPRPRRRPKAGTKAEPSREALPKLLPPRQPDLPTDFRE